MSCVIYDPEGKLRVRTEVADTFVKRLGGLMFRRRLPAGRALLLLPCGGVHTCFMRFAIDVVYLNRQHEVIGKETLPPWRMGHFFKGTKFVLELNAGKAAAVAPGSRLTMDGYPRGWK